MPIEPDRTWIDACSEPGETMAPTLDPDLRTYRDTAEHGDWTKSNPWRSPGYAPVFSPCGLAGGGDEPGDWMSDSLQRHIRAGAVSPPFIRRGFDGRQVPDGPKAKWSQGSIQEVAWSMFVNKGGGYAYRLCPKVATDGSATLLTEKCFQDHHLAFASNTSIIQFGSNESTRTPIPAARTSVGTFPPGSIWTRNPVPPCSEPNGSPVQDPPSCPQPMFAPPAPLAHLYGDGPGSCVNWAIHGPVEGYHTIYDSFGNAVYQAPCSKGEGLDLARRFQFNVFDEVVIPQDLDVGEYVLSFRLDAEQTPQVWAHCADVAIVPSPRELI